MFYSNSSRRSFIKKASLATAAAWLGHSVYAQSPSYLTFDYHAHPITAKTFEDMQMGKLSGAFFGLVADMPIIEVTPEGVKPKGSYNKGEGWKEYKRQLATYQQLIKGKPVITSFHADDLLRAQKENKTAFFLAIEGGDFLEGEASRLDEMYADGVRSMQLVHYHPSDLGNLQTSAPEHSGLSATGKDVVRKMNKLKMVIDVAHAAEDTVKAVVDLTDSPIILSHSILKMDENRPIAKRAITPDHAKLIAKTDGVIGAWPSGFNTSFDEFIDNIKRLADVVGTAHVGLGTDMDGNFKPVLSSYTQLPQWTDALKSKGFTESEVRQIAGGNAERVLRKILG